MTSEIDIANLALAEAASRSSIASLDEDSPEAAEAKRFFGPVRDQVGRAARWGFMRRTALLTMLKCSPGAVEFTGTSTGLWSSSYPPPGWLYSYALPSDALSFWRVLPQSNPAVAGIPMFSVAALSNMVADCSQRPARFEIATDLDASGNPQTVVLCNETQAIGVYGMRISDPGVWDSLFAEAVVQALAAKLAIAISGDKGLADRKYKAANDAIVAARVVSANEGATVAEAPADWIAARGGLPYGAAPGYAWAPYGPLFAA